MSTTIKVDELTDIRVLRHNYLTLAVVDGHTINGATLHVVNNSVRVEGNVTQDTTITIARGTLGAGTYQFNHQVPYDPFHRVKVTYSGSGDMYVTSGDLPDSGQTVTIDQEVNFSLYLELKATYGDGATIFNDVAMLDKYESSGDSQSITIQTDEEADITSAITTFKGGMNKNGKAEVWLPGYGKNKLKTTATEETVNGLTFSPNDDGTVNVSGTSSEALTVSTDSEIYSKRVVENGYRLFDEVVGGSVVWNQLVDLQDQTRTMSGVTYVVSNGIITANGTSTGTSFVGNTSTFTQNHVYYFCGCPKDGSSSRYFVDTGANLGRETGNGIIKKYTGATTEAYMRFYVVSGYTATNLKATIQLFDLTQMFGTTIADYIYNLEQSSSGSGVALFKKLFNEDYYAYNSGTIMSVSTSSHELVGFNQFDISQAELRQGSFDGAVNTYNVSTDGYTNVLPNTTYNFHSEIAFYSTNRGRYIRFYDSNKNRIMEHYVSNYTNSDFTFTTPNNAFYIRFMIFRSEGITVSDAENGNICINISDPSRNGTYEPYQKNTYSLSPLTLRGIPKLVDNKIVYDGDIYKSSGEVTRRYGEVDLGTLNWTYSDSVVRFMAYLPTEVSGTTDRSKLNWLCAKYESSVRPWSDADRTDKQITVAGRQVLVRDSAYTDATAFKASLSGVKLVYELATPTTESTTPFTKPQECEQGGTEEYVDYEVSQGNRDVSIPVGHNTLYADYVVSDEAKLTEGETYNVSENLTVGYRDSSGMHTVTNSLTIPSGGEYEFSAYTGDGASIEPMIYQGDDSSYLPYENLGKFSEYGSARLDVTVNGETTSYMTLLNPANYGGSYDFVSGKETRTWGHIESYNGETLPTVWESDRDDYVEGTTPSVGAEVCYELATPTETQYTAQEIALTSGATSTLSSPQGNITVVVNQPLVGE